MSGEFDNTTLVTAVPARNTHEERFRATRQAATLATDSVDLADLLAALGLNAKEGKR